MIVESMVSAAIVLGCALVALSRFGLWSPQFLGLFHLFLSIPGRALFIALYPQSDKYLLSDVLYYTDGRGITFLLSLSCVIFLFISIALSRSSLSRFNEHEFSLRVDRIAMFGSAVLLVYIFAAAYLFGGIGNAVSGFLSRTVNALEGYSYINVLADIYIACSVAIYYSWRISRNRNHLILSSIFVPAALVLLALSGGRGNLIQYILMLCMLTFGQGAKFGKKAFAVLAVLLLFVASVVPVGLAVRKSVQAQSDLGQEISIAYGSMIPTMSAPFALLDHFELSRVYVDAHGFDYGKQFALFVAKPIPRALWPEKPLPIAIEMRQEFFGDTLGGIPPGLMGEFFISFGWLCILLTPLFMVAVIHTISSLSHAKVLKGSGYLLYAMLVPYFAFNLLRGGIDIGIMRMLIVVASVHLVVMVSSRGNLR